MVVFRDQEGKASVLDAYCPHLGANLAVGGRVVGNCIECPFHGWQFRGDDGKCVKIPYAEKGRKICGFPFLPRLLFGSFCMPAGKKAAMGDLIFQKSNLNPLKCFLLIGVSKTFFNVYFL